MDEDEDAVRKAKEKAENTSQTFDDQRNALDECSKPLLSLNQVNLFVSLVSHGFCLAVPFCSS